MSKDRNQDRGEKKPDGNKPRPQRIDLSENRGFLERMIVNEVENMVEVFGENIGRKLPFLAQGVDALRSLVGEPVTTMIMHAATDSLAAVAQVPAPFKDWVKKHGGDRLVNANLDRGMDGLIRAIGKSVSTVQVGGKAVQMLDVDEAKRNLAKVHEDFAKGLPNTKSLTFDESILFLRVEEQDQLDTILREFTPEDRLKFEGYRQKLASPDALKLFIRRCLILNDEATRSKERISYLERTYGLIKPPATAGGVMASIGGAIKRVDASIMKAIGPPATGPDPLVESMNKETARLKRRRRGQ